MYKPKIQYKKLFKSYWYSKINSGDSFSRPISTPLKNGIVD